MMFFAGLIAGVVISATIVTIILWKFVNNLPW